MLPKILQETHLPAEARRAEYRRRLLGAWERRILWGRVEEPCDFLVDERRRTLVSPMSG